MGQDSGILKRAEGTLLGWVLGGWDPEGKADLMGRGEDCRGFPSPPSDTRGTPSSWSRREFQPEAPKWGGQGWGEVGAVSLSSGWKEPLVVLSASCQLLPCGC